MATNKASTHCSVFNSDNFPNLIHRNIGKIISFTFKELIKEQKQHSCLLLAHKEQITDPAYLCMASSQCYSSGAQGSPSPCIRWGPIGTNTNQRTTGCRNTAVKASPQISHCHLWNFSWTSSKDGPLLQGRVSCLVSKKKIKLICKWHGVLNLRNSPPAGKSAA